MTLHDTLSEEFPELNAEQIAKMVRLMTEAAVEAQQPGFNDKVALRRMHRDRPGLLSLPVLVGDLPELVLSREDHAELRSRADILRASLDDRIIKMLPHAEDLTPRLDLRKYSMLDKPTNPKEQHENLIRFDSYDKDNERYKF
jgi:hypothetical protein